MDRPMTAAPDPPDSSMDVWDRTTAPQSPFSSREVGIGLFVFLVGTGAIFGLPLLLG